MAKLIGVALAQTVVFAVLIILCWAAVLARLYVRVFVLNRIGADDYFMMVALVGFTVISSLAIEMARLGLGQHASSLSRGEIIGVLKIFYCEELLYGFTTVALKFSIMLLLLRLANERIHKLLLKGTAYFYLASSCAFVVTSIFQCWPIQRYWNTQMDGHCIPLHVYTALVYLNAIINLVTDGIFSILPTFLIWNVQVDTRTKISLSIVLGLGISTCGVNIARFNYIGALKENVDRTYVLFPIGLTSILEIAIGIIAAALATLRPLLRKIQCKARSGAIILHRPSNTEITVDKQNTGPEKESAQHCIQQSDVDEWREICNLANSRAVVESKHLWTLPTVQFNDTQGERLTLATI